ncbi:GIN domain-containing protein [Brevundimonas sp.]|uniref:GIN domain-containing protein n=1 Tax=Brevundimonas sp. TaxID=1871086 RepID=UPI002FC5C746
MIRTLLIITGASLVLCVATLSGAAAIGGNDLARHGWEWTFHDGDRSETVTFERSDNSPPVTRNLAWTGGDSLAVEIPGDVTYVQGDTPSVVITGRKSLVDRVNLIDGRLTWDENDDEDHVVFGWSNNSRLRVVVTAPAVKRFDLQSSADLSIRGYDQPTFELNVSGSGDVDASGETRTARIDTTGSGDSDLSGLRLTDADIDTSGSGDLRVGPTGTATIDISGSGDVDLTRRPANLTQSVSGSGDIDQN